MRHPPRAPRARGRDTRLLGLSWADETQLILASPESGITTVRDLKGRRFGLPDWARVEIDFSRAQAIRGLENALRLEGLEVADVELIDQRIDAHYSDAPAQRGGGTISWNARSGSRARANNLELVALLRGEVDAIFLKGAHGAQAAHQFGLTSVIDTGAHPDPLVRSNNGTPRTLAVDGHLLDHHFDAATTIVEQVLRAEAWAQHNPDAVRRYLALETNTSEYWVERAYGRDAETRLKTDLSDTSRAALQDFIHFLHRWGFIPESFSAADWIDERPLAAARDRLSETRVPALAG